MTRRLSRARIIDDLSFIIGRARPALTTHRWEVDGVSCTAERQSHTGPAFGFYVDITILNSRQPRWTLMLVSDFWEAGATTTLHSSKWLKLLDGKQADVTAWIERNLPLGRHDLHAQA